MQTIRVKIEDLDFFLSTANKLNIHNSADKEFSILKFKCIILSKLFIPTFS